MEFIYLIGYIAGVLLLHMVIDSWQDFYEVT